MSKRCFAEAVLSVKGVSVSKTSPFVSSSGLKLPIYCDHRLLISHPRIREKIVEGLIERIVVTFGVPDIVVGVATGAIPYTAWVSSGLNIPMAYVRPQPKCHGRQRQLEGVVHRSSTAVIVEDVLVVGSSSLEVYELMLEQSVTVWGVAAIFTYGLGRLEENFGKHDIRYTTLYDLSTLFEVALEKKYFGSDEFELLQRWRERPYEFYG